MKKYYIVTKNYYIFEIHFTLNDLIQSQPCINIFSSLGFSRLVWDSSTIDWDCYGWK